ncbi:hypothetical protein DACRYDRAFT_103585 [Dacryopinax primogenitus]|uniref:CCD97-like C-terminal domain-containing protein n=1 Tax=Dacryopinax primogenitus (strain DJM 731) TaxID=1858805 RepID=M5GD70_DACPD|nr:uncharacterized protein DACRYDRAFT_103585 [Dacryopinax primogenitus]EJU06635.1 hypothetical protein DACRYDRAFT_103585 [Dacryopinax primogenitus]
MTSTTTFDPAPVLNYLSLPSSSSPSPTSQPLLFLRQHLPHLPPSHASAFSNLLTPAERAALPLIRARRLAYALHDPSPHQLTWSHAASQEPMLWTAHGGPSSGLSPARLGEREAQEETEWTKSEFIGRRGPGGGGMIGNLGRLLGEFEGERVGEAERVARIERATRAASRVEQHGEQEDEDMDSLSEHETSSEEEGGMTAADAVKHAFERAVRERFVEGLLEWADYVCDWETDCDGEWERDGEERWFDQEEEQGRGEGDTGELDY